MSEHTTVLPEYSPQPEPRKSWGVVAVVASVVVVVLVVAGGFAAWRWFSGARSAAGRGAAGLDLRASSRST